MKLLKLDKQRCRFELEAREKQVLFRVLSLYPLIPAGHQKLTRAEANDENQKLLDEALAAQREENRRQLVELLQAKSRFRKTAQGHVLSLKHAEMEWLLQVLNDIRVGGWIHLGSPDGFENIIAALNEENVHYFWAMEAAGHFQTALLEARKSG